MIAAGSLFLHGEMIVLTQLSRHSNARQDKADVLTPLILTQLEELTLSKYARGAPNFAEHPPPSASAPRAATKRVVREPHRLRSER